ncbi:pentapeptide repeat-containing protein [Mesorhizobium sp. B2-4-19]|uniref:pentapeptide repeat-containing protein n=1 Tax=Mesorhizobium sp. B2-4-19 TaxID=2589930 RepID=UPI001128A9CC|nr:pentapeptide repeat-containing protein [Mesorhizobium sp. B2-4-19]TPK65284.1 pentapeptide repeat-containing protein [Mesorhizobium sp. B2-4-19]
MNSLPLNEHSGEEEIDRAETLRRQANDIGAARSALDSAASMARGLWISFISLSAYLAIAIGSVTHRMLFLEEPLQLPIINIKLPLVAFFWIAPILFLVLHAYLLLHLKFAGDNIREWERLTKLGLRGLPDVDEGQAIEDSLRMQLPNFLLVQMLVPPKANRAGIIYLALTATVLITVIVGPVLLLSLIQLQFLPYHNWAVTWVHRLLIVADLGLIGLLWPLVLGRPIRSWRTPFQLATYVCAIAMLWISIIIATFPGERMYQSSGLGIQMLRSYLFEGSTNEVDGRSNSWFSNRLVLTGQHFVDLGDDALKNTETTQSFRGRHLEQAVLIRADLRKADFTDAFMDEAILDRAKLGGARFGCGRTGKSDDQDISDCTKLRGASFELAELQGVIFQRARLQGAKFQSADLQGASLSGAALQGASLEGANLRGALLDHAWLQGASLYESKLEGAILGMAHLEAANLDWAQLRGAMLFGAELQGASFLHTDFTGAKLDNALVWRIRAPMPENFEFVTSSQISWQTKFRLPNGEIAKSDSEAYARVVAQAMDSVTIEETRGAIVASLAVLDPDQPDPKDSLGKDAKRFWDNFQAAHNPPNDASYLTNRANYLADLACQNDAPLTRGLLRDHFEPSSKGSITSMYSQRHGIAVHILDGLEMGTCPGAIGVGDDALARLHDWAPDWKPNGDGSASFRRLAASFRAVLDPALFVAEEIFQ